MKNVDCLDLLEQELEFFLFFESEQREALELLLRGKGVCMCPTNSLICQMFVDAKSSSSSVQRPTVIVISPV